MADAGVIADGILAIQHGRIAAVGTRAQLCPPRIDDSFDGLLTPGLINAHTHLELTDIPRPPTPGTFQDWLLTTMASLRDADPATFAAKRAAAVRAGIAQCVRFGVTFVGDISQNVSITRPILRDAPVRSISYGECLGLGPRRKRFGELLESAVDVSLASPRMKIGVSPHAPYTVEPCDYKRALLAGEEIGGFVTTHVAETPDESDFLNCHGGAFGEMYRRLGFDPGPGTPWRHGVLDKLHNTGLTKSGVLLAHMNYLTDNDIAECGRARSRIVWCPRTHAYFGHPPHPWQKLKAAGATICVGTDSCASSGDLNVMDDLRLVRQQLPDVPAEQLWAMVTTESSKAMRGTALAQMQPSGALSVGQPADFVVWPTQTGDPLAEVLDTPGLFPESTWVDGQLVSV